MYFSKFKFKKKATSLILLLSYSPENTVLILIVIGYILTKFSRNQIRVNKCESKLKYYYMLVTKDYLIKREMLENAKDKSNFTFVCMHFMDDYKSADMVAAL